MPETNAQVVTGPVGPSAPFTPAAPAPEPAAAPAPRKRKVAPPPDPDIVRFRSKYAGFRVQITAPADVFEPATGRVIRSRPVVAQFQAGVYETKDKAIIEALKKNRGFGLGLNFWLAADQARADAAVAVREAVSKVHAASAISGAFSAEQQAVVDALLDQLKSAGVSEQFEMPPARIG